MGQSIIFLLYTMVLERISDLTTSSCKGGGIERTVPSKMLALSNVIDLLRIKIENNQITA